MGHVSHGSGRGASGKGVMRTEGVERIVLLEEEPREAASECVHVPARVPDWDFFGVLPRLDKPPIPVGLGRVRMHPAVTARRPRTAQNNQVLGQVDFLLRCLGAELPVVRVAAPPAAADAPPVSLLDELDRPWWHPAHVCGPSACTRSASRSEAT